MDMKKFLFVGVAGGLSSMANAISIVTISAASHVATHASVGGHQAVQAAQASVPPGAFLHPELVYGAFGVVMAGLVIASGMAIKLYYDEKKSLEAAKNIEPPTDNKENSVKRMKGLREYYLESLQAKNLKTP